MAKTSNLGREQRLLPWEDPTEWETLRATLHDAHEPGDATERLLVDRLAWIEWRRKRLALAERAAHMAALTERAVDPTRTFARAGLNDPAARERSDLLEVIASPPGEDDALRQDHTQDRKATARALAILAKGGAGAYAAALKALHVDTRSWWQDGLAGEYGDERAWTADAGALGAFLREEVTPADAAMERAYGARGAVRLQASGESFDPLRMDRLLAIEARLDRQFDKALSTLIQLQSLRVGRQLSPPQSRAVAAPLRGVPKD